MNQHFPNQTTLRKIGEAAGFPRFGGSPWPSTFLALSPVARWAALGVFFGDVEPEYVTPESWLETGVGYWGWINSMPGSTTSFVVSKIRGAGNIETFTIICAGGNLIIASLSGGGFVGAADLLCAGGNFVSAGFVGSGNIENVELINAESFSFEVEGVTGVGTIENGVLTMGGSTFEVAGLNGAGAVGSMEITFVSVHDEFTTDGVLTSPWTVSLTAMPTVSGGKAVAPNPDAGHGAYWSATFADDQFISAKPGYSGTSTGWGSALRCRQNAGSTDWLDLLINYTGGAKSGATLRKGISSSVTNLVTGIDAAGTYNYYGLFAQGQSPDITVYAVGKVNSGDNWTLLAGAAGITGPNSGYPGFLVKSITAGSGVGSIDDWAGGGGTLSVGQFTDNFTGSNDAAPSTTYWNAPSTDGASGSGVTIQSNALRLRAISESAGTYRNALVTVKTAISAVPGRRIDFKMLSSPPSGGTDLFRVAVAGSGLNYVYVQLYKGTTHWKVALIGYNDVQKYLIDNVQIASTDVISLILDSATTAKVQLNGSDIIASTAHNATFTTPTIYPACFTNTTSTVDFTIDDFRVY